MRAAMESSMNSVLECNRVWLRAARTRGAVFVVRLCNQFLILRRVLLMKEKGSQNKKLVAKTHTKSIDTGVSKASTEIKYTTHIVHRCFDRWRCRCFAVHVQGLHICELGLHRWGHGLRISLRLCTLARFLDSEACVFFNGTRLRLGSSALLPIAHGENKLTSPKTICNAHASADRVSRIAVRREERDT